MDTYLILFYPWTPHKYGKSWSYFKDGALIAIITFTVGSDHNVENKAALESLKDDRIF